MKENSLQTREDASPYPFSYHCIYFSTSVHPDKCKSPTPATFLPYLFYHTFSCTRTSSLWMVRHKGIPSSTVGRNARAPVDGATDRFGFFVTAEEKRMDDECLRVYAEKKSVQNMWSKALTRWDNCPHDRRKELCRLGIPQSQRQTIWPLLLMTYGWKDENCEDYQLLMAQQPQDKSIFDVIERDLGRTFPTHRMFFKANGEGQKKLRRILRTYVNHNPDIGYVQGMGFIAATLLLQIGDEESTFRALVSVMENPKYNLAKLYAPGFPCMFARLYQLQKLLERHYAALFNKLVTYKIELSLFASNWYLTLFSYHLNFRLLSRIWDMFLCEGWKIIHRVAVALLLLHRDAIDGVRDESQLIMALQSAHEGKDEAEILKKALSIKVKTARLLRWEKEFNLLRSNR
uniref:Putative GTPase activating protein n=1 Tax=Trypanosoma congolense (strain IL3000) TaxID=1068625 RepID=G0UX61_TRYCI|nr:putative GTPase activating protein [Trypanosoma congolense IL3000]